MFAALIQVYFLLIRKHFNNFEAFCVLHVRSAAVSRAVSATDTFNHVQVHVQALL